MSKTILIADKIIPLSSPPLSGYAVIIEGDTIIDIETVQSAERKNPRAKKIVFDTGVLMPGLINIHTHLELSLFKGIFLEGMGFFEWAHELIKRKKTMKKDEYRVGVIAGLNELIKTGTTSIGEITSEGISPYIIHNYGLRGKVYYEVIGPPEILAGYLWTKKRREMRRFKKSDLLDAGLSPHACYSLSCGLLKRVSRYSSKHGISLSSHISETEAEVELIRTGGGPFNTFIKSIGFKNPLPFHAPSPVAYFKGLGLLKKDFIAAHAVWVNEEDMEIMKESSVSVAHCPRSNINLDVGKSPVIRLIKKGVNVGLGTDSLASNYSLNMWDEMRMAYKLHREDGIKPYDIFRMATQNGARALGLENKVGTIEPGKKADIIAVNIDDFKGDDIYSYLLKETRDVILTMVSGNILYREGMNWN